MTDYPTHPTDPRYLDKVESPHIHQKAPTRRVRIVSSVDSIVSQQSRNAETPAPISQNSDTRTTINQNR